MSSAVASIEIDRPVADVFRFVAEPANEPFWHTDVVGASLEPAGPPAAGKVLHAVFRTMGRAYPAVADVTAFDDERRIVYAFRGRIMGMQPTLTYTFEPAAAGIGTRFTRRLDVRPAGVMSLVLPLMGRSLRSGNARFVRNLKRHLEAAR